MYKIQMTKTFRKDTERCRKRGYDMELLKTAIVYLKPVANFPNHIAPTSYPAIMAGVGNAT